MLLIVSGLSAQVYTKPYNLPKLDRKFLTFGFQIGINTYKAGVRPVPNLTIDTLFQVQPRGQQGFSMGILSEMRLGESFTLRFIPTLAFGQRTIEYTLLNRADTTLYQINKAIESTYLEAPLLIKFRSARINNWRTYIVGGFKYGYDLASKVNSIDNQDLVKLKRHDYSVEAGFGFDFYLEYFKFSPELRVSWGLNNTLFAESHVFSAGIERIYSRCILISFFFQ